MERVIGVVIHLSSIILGCRQWSCGRVVEPTVLSSQVFSLYLAVLSNSFNSLSNWTPCLEQGPNNRRPPRYDIVAVTIRTIRLITRPQSTHRKPYDSRKRSARRITKPDPEPSLQPPKDDAIGTTSNSFVASVWDNFAPRRESYIRSIKRWKPDYDPKDDYETMILGSWTTRPPNTTQEDIDARFHFFEMLRGHIPLELRREHAKTLMDELVETSGVSDAYC